MFDSSDEATGLPDLTQIDPADAIFAVTWTIGVEGLTSVPAIETPVAVRYLSVRGLITAADGKAEWGQVHIAFPADSVRPLAEAWLQQVSDEGL